MHRVWSAPGSLRVGVPLVTVPLFASLPTSSRTPGVSPVQGGVRIEAGRVKADGSRRPVGTDAEHEIAEAMRTVLDEGSYRRQARLIAEEMAAEREVRRYVCILLAKRSRGAVLWGSSGTAEPLFCGGPLGNTWDLMAEQAQARQGK